MEPITLSRTDIKDRETVGGHAIVRKARRFAAWRFKACRRCGGDLALQTDEYGFQDYTCIQCGATEPSPTRAA